MNNKENEKRQVNRGLLTYGVLCLVFGVLGGSIVCAPLGAYLIYGAFKN